VAEAGLRRAQGPLAQNAALGMHQREGRIVADRAEIAEVIGDALKLGHERAEPDAARRNFGPKGGLDGMSEGEGVGHGAVTRDAACEPRALVETCSSHQRLSALMHIAETLFQPRHRFAAASEAEMTWLDDAGMDRADRNLV
jgi:hypothetical protein